MPSFFYAFNYISFSLDNMNEIITPAHPVSCTQCQTKLKEGHKFCTNCGFPQIGTEREQASFHARLKLKEKRSYEASRKIKGARNSLYVISGLSMLFGVIFFFLNDDPATLVASSVLAIIYLALGFWCETRPLIAIVLGLIVFLTTIVAGAIVEPGSLFKGIIIKIIVFSYLLKGVSSAIQLRKYQNQ